MDPVDDYSPEEAFRRFPSNNPQYDNDDKPDNRYVTNNNNRNMLTSPKFQISPDELFEIMNRDSIYNADKSGMAASAVDKGPPIFTRLNDTDAFINETLAYMMNPPEVWIFGEKEDAILLPLLLSAVGICAVIGNLLVLYAFFRYKNMRSGQNLMLVNVSLADMIFVFITIPVTIVNHTVGLGYDPEARRSTPPPPQLCRFVHYIIFVGVYVSIYTLVVTCVFRFFGEFMKSRNSQQSENQSVVAISDRSTFVRGTMEGGAPPLTLGNAALSCAVIWIAFITSHLNFLIQKEGAIFEEPFICEHYDGLSDTAKLRTLWVTFLTCAFLLPLLIVCTLSVLILRGVKDRCRKEFQMNSRSIPRSIRRQSSSAYSDRLRSGSYSGRRDSFGNHVTSQQGYSNPQGHSDLSVKYHFDPFVSNGTLQKARPETYVDGISLHSKSPRDQRRQMGSSCSDLRDQGGDCEIVSTDVYDGALTGRLPDRRRLPSDNCELTQNCLNDSRSRRELTMVVMISTIIRCICWLPIQIFLLVDVFTPGPVGPLGASIRSDPGRTVDVYHKAEMLAVCFAFAATLVNPFVYQCASFQFRRAFSHTFSRIFCCFSQSKQRNNMVSPAGLQTTPVRLADMNETILSIISDSSNRINYA